MERGGSTSNLSNTGTATKRKKMENKYNIPTIHEALRRDVLSGKITLRQAAIEFHKAGWLPYIDEKETAKRIDLK